MYGNESATAKGLSAWFESSGRSREELFITSKLLASVEGEGGVSAGCRRSLDALGLEYFDM